MLKLVTAFEINYEIIIDYKMSFNGKLNECSFAIYRAKKDNKDEYLKWLSKMRIITHYFLIDDDNPNYIIGDGSIDNYLDYHMEYLNNGAISYTIRPNERNKKYGTKLLGLLLKQCQKFGMKEVCISCLESNIGSKKIIEKNGGQLEKRFHDQDSCKYGIKYWINLTDTEKDFVKNNKNVY